jgi:hypothetical protein
MKGDLNVTNIPCDTTNNICTIPVKAPGFALVFFNPQDEFTTLGQVETTFTTSVHVKTRNTATVDPKVLATSNGHSGKDRKGVWGSTSKAGGLSNGAQRDGRMLGAAIVLGGIGMGVMVVVGGFVW